MPDNEHDMADDRENPYLSPTDTGTAQGQRRRFDVVAPAMKRGAKYGFVLGSSIALVVAVVAWTIVLLFVEPPDDLSTYDIILIVILGAPLGILFYGVVGAVLGAGIMGAIAAIRWTSSEFDCLNEDSDHALGSDPVNR